MSDHQRGRFTAIDEDYPITVGHKYVVVGMGIWETVLSVLVRDDHGRPGWFPAALFDIPPQPVPNDWEFALAPGVRLSGAELWTQWVARWGYHELVRSDEHSDALMERDAAALRVFGEEERRQSGSGQQAET